MARGHRLSTSRTDATIPIQQIAISMCELLENQSNVGAYQKRTAPSLAERLQILAGRQNTFRTDQPFDLEHQRVKS